MEPRCTNPNLFDSSFINFLCSNLTSIMLDFCVHPQEAALFFVFPTVSMSFFHL